MEGNGCVQRLDLAETSTLSMLKFKNDVKSASRLGVYDEHVQNAARGPLKYVGPGPSAPHFENVHFEKKDRGRRPPHRRVFKQGSTCLHRPSLPVYPGLVYMFTQAWSTCLPRPGIFQDMETPSKTFIFHWFRHLRGPQASRLSPRDPAWKVSMTPSISAKFIIQRPQKWCSIFWRLANERFSKCC